jgi:photosystem II reaction center protein PsbP
MQVPKVTISQFFVHFPFLHTSYSINLTMCFLFSIFVSYTSVSQLAVAQQISSSESSEGMIKRLLSEAVEKLDSGNSSKTVQNLLSIQRLIVQNNDNSTSTHDSMLLIRETVAAILNGRSDIAKTNLSLLDKQLIAQPQGNVSSVTSPVVKTVPSNHSAGLINQTKAVTSPVVKTVPSNHSAGLINQTKAVTSPVVKTVPSNHSAGLINQTKTFDNGTSTGFQTYQNHILGIKIGYPHSWYVRTYPYNNAANNTVAGFYSPSNTASELGNISGVSGHFVPYVDIFVFDSKNMSLDKIIKGRINRIQNTSDFLIDSKPITLRGNNSAHMLVYSTTTGSDESFKKLQVYTISDNKVYLITFTAQEALFSNYLPKVLKMIDSFEI